MKALAYCIATLLLFTTIAFPRIGETEAQIERRYGQPASGPGSTKEYSYKDLFVIITFDNGVSAIETYEKRNHSPMTDIEIGAALHANGAGAKWHKRSRNEFEVRYETKERIAEYNAFANTLTIAKLGTLITSTSGVIAPARNK